VIKLQTSLALRRNLRPGSASVLDVASELPQRPGRPRMEWESSLLALVARTAVQQGRCGVSAATCNLARSQYARASPTMPRAGEHLSPTLTGQREVIFRALCSLGARRARSAACFAGAHGSGPVRLPAPGRQLGGDEAETSAVLRPDPARTLRFWMTEQLGLHLSRRQFWD